MNRFLFYFGATGWVLSLIIHLLSFAQIDVTDKVPIRWLLHTGIFVIWIPMLLQLSKDEELKKIRPESMLNNPRGSLMIIFRNTPQWMIVIAIAGFFYAIVNFILLTGYRGDPEFINGQYVLRSHGMIIKTFTESGYHHYLASQVRSISGYWIAFYGIAAAVLFPFSKQANKGR